MNSREIALRISNLDYHYRTEWLHRKILTLHGISLEVYAGESFGFLGHNGAGKTTTIKCILDLIKPSAGQIEIFGISWRRPDARRAIGYLPEQPYFYDHLTVREIMEMYAMLAGIAPSERAQKIETALERVRLPGKRKSPLRTLSKGLMQRVALAQAIVHDPRILILDEPFSGLDPIGRREFRELFSELKKAGTTIFMSSHILGDVEFLCDRASIMVRGEIKGVFSLHETKSESGIYELALRADIDAPTELREELGRLDGELRCEERYWRFTSSDRDVAHQALKLSLDREMTIDSFEFLHGSLEDLFVKLVSESGKERSTHP